MLTKQINDAVSGNRRCLVVFLDLAKAFDSVKRSKLLKTLELIGCWGISYSWFEIFLSGRKQFVSIGGIDSDKRSVDFGVIQGSTLGP
ncbi:reverse transcriptase domain-containing protein, partial [Klebsiella pneumoniae]|uniref:reverse transcriptase domain-containing protein n=1 Tax=Klebsiella pneumoniae TaxID=573 RepID=UPI00117BD289